ncbi:MAG: UDP-3-O-(3-hydroxymyristoyl)glucosamine N-acyltransferase [Bacteroidota bacterium]
MKFAEKVTLQELSALLNCPFKGAPDHLVLGINEIHRVEIGDLTFVDVEKYYSKALNCAATTILINKEVSVPEGKGILISDDPFRDFNRLTEYFQPSISLAFASTKGFGETVQLGQNVVWGKDVSIGEGTQIGHNVTIGSHVTIGKNCRIHPNVSIYGHTVIGDEVCINSGAVIGGEAFYFKSWKDSKAKMLSKGRVIIESHVDIGANCTIDRGVTADTVIGEYTKLDNLIQVGHDTVIGKRCLIASQVGIAGVVTIEDDVILWGQVGVTKDLTIGKGAVLMGKTGVMSSLEGGKTYLGMIAAPLRQKLREVAALKKLPDLLRRMEGK